MKKQLAVLITCFNRKEDTLSCIHSLSRSFENTSDFTMNIYLVDDGSTDGTSEAIAKSFPVVNLIQGTGNLFWNKGMRLAWQTAINSPTKYDYYIWLNDDTILDKNSLAELFLTYTKAVKKEGHEVIVTGACRMTNDEANFSYGGRDEKGPVIPNGKIQECKYINGNVVLVPSGVYHSIGILSPDYTHAMGDFDYGIRAINAGYKCYTTENFVATCPTNNGIPKWCNPETPIIKRLKLLYDPLGLNLPEYNTFRRKFWRIKWLVYAVKAHFKALSPTLYTIIKK